MSKGKKIRQQTQAENRFEARVNHTAWQSQKYCEAHTSTLPKLLFDLERETYRKTLAPQMLSGRLQGQFLRMISQMLRPQHILEIGTFTGYATICLSAGLLPDGQITTIEANDELAYIIKKYFQKAGIKKQTRLLLGDANGIIPTLTAEYDLIFMDAAKRDYLQQYRMLVEKLLPGGILLADNVLWSGKVLEENRNADAEAMHAFNQFVQADERVQNVLLPLRDGLMMVRKM